MGLNMAADGWIASKGEELLRIVEFHVHHPQVTG